MPKPRRPLRWIPTRTPAYGSRAFNQLYLNRLDDALLTITRASGAQAGTATIAAGSLFRRLLEGGRRGTQTDGDGGQKEPSSWKTCIPHLEALALARSGRLQDARRMSAVSRRDRAAVGSTRTGRLVRSGQSRVGSVLRQCGRRQAERQPRRSRLEGAATWIMPRHSRWPLSGDLRQARALAQDLAREFPEDTFVQFMYLPTLRALFALNTHDPAAAIQALQVASRYDLHTSGVGFNRTLRRLVPDLRSRTGVPRGAATGTRLPPSSSGFSIIAASCSSIPWTRWRACSWHERSRSRATR